MNMQFALWPKSNNLLFELIKFNNLFMFFCKLLIGTDPMTKQKKNVFGITKFIKKLLHKINFL